MKLTARVFVLKDSTSKMRAFGTLIIDEVIELGGFKIFEGAKGLFVAVPSTLSKKTTEDGKPIYDDNIRFLDIDDEKKSAAKDEISSIILEAYNKQISSNTRTTTAASRTNDPAPTGKRPSMSTTAKW
jgi:DNA-binding cell septation regulator SpoVG